MMKTQIATADKATLCRMIRAHISQRSGIDSRNYGNRENFMEDYRPMLRDGRDARRMLEWIESRDGITAADIRSATGFNGRLEFSTGADGRLRLEYCTGQYFVTEYRAAACSMLSGIVWRYLADQKYTADRIRRDARGYFGRGIASRWFR